MIETVRIQNFQSHEKTILDFNKGVNVIIGSSDSGKSAIMRAIRWLVYNRPTGDAFRSYWGGDTIVTIVFNNGIEVTRRKGKKNYYKTIVNGEKQIFKAFGTQVPDEVQQILNLSDLNIQQQLDSPFLLSNSAGEVASHFNKIADLSIIDFTITNLNKEIYESNREVNSLNKLIENTERELKEYSFLDVFEIELLNLEDMETTFKTNQNMHQTLNTLQTTIQETEQEIDEKSDVLGLEKEVDIILDLYSKGKEVTNKIGGITKFINSIEFTTLEIDEKSEILGTEPIVNTLLQEISNEKVILSQIKTLNNKIVQIDTYNKKLLRTQEKANRKENLFHKEFPSECPLCGTKIKMK